MAALEFIIAVLFICLLISLFVSWIIDMYASKMNRKGKFLQEMLTKLMGRKETTNWVKHLYEHPLIKSLSVKSNRLTSYIPANIFSQVVADLLKENGEEKSNESSTGDKKAEVTAETPAFIDELRNGIEKMPDGDLKKMIKSFFDKAENNSEVFLKSLEDWYNEYMVRVNYTYKRLLKLPLWILGIVVAILFNIDMLRITSELWTDINFRNAVSGAAIEYVENTDDAENTEKTKDFFQEYKTSLALPVGWDYEKDYKTELIKTDQGFSIYKYWLFKILGLILTGMIASFGAPFWYDALQKVVGLKKSVKIKTE